MLRRVGERFGAEEVERRLCQRVGRLDVDGQVDGQRRPADQFDEGGHQPAARQGRRMDAPCEVSELRPGPLEVRSEPFHCRAPRRRQAAPGQQGGDPLEALDGACLEPPLETAPLIVGSVDEPLPRGLDLGDTRADLRLHRGVRHRQRRRGRQCRDEARVVEDGRIVGMNPMGRPATTIGVTARPGDAGGSATG